VPNQHLQAGEFAADKPARSEDGGFRGNSEEVGQVVVGLSAVTRVYPARCGFDSLMAGGARGYVLFGSAMEGRAKKGATGSCPPWTLAVFQRQGKERLCVVKPHSEKVVEAEKGCHSFRCQNHGARNL